MYASTNYVIKLQTLTTMDPKDYNETSIKVETGATKITDTPKKSRSRQEISSRSSNNLSSTDTMNTQSIQSRFLGSCEGMNGHIFDIGTTPSDRYIKTKKDLVVYFSCTYSNVTKKSIVTPTYKLTRIVGPIMPTKQVADPTTNVEAIVEKLEGHLTYLENLDIN